MTTLDKSAMVSNFARKLTTVDSAKAVQNRQTVATGGNDVPPTRAGTLPVMSEAARKKGLDQALKSVSGYVQNISRELNFSVDEELNKSIVTVLDQETGEVIRQIPSEEMVELARHLEDVQKTGENKPKGILFNGDA